MTARVLHSVHAWLRQTETIIFNQIRSLPADIESYGVCRRLTGPERFPWPNLDPLKRRRFVQRNLDQLSRHLVYATIQSTW